MDLCHQIKLKMDLQIQLRMASHQISCEYYNNVIYANGRKTTLLLYF